MVDSSASQTKHTTVGEIFDIVENDVDVANDVMLISASVNLLKNDATLEKLLATLYVVKRPKPRLPVPFIHMPSHEEQFLSFIDRCVEDDPSLVVSADEEQLERLAKILGIARQGIETYSDALKQL